MKDTKEVPEESQEISLRLEHYDDIFSDFDVRPYAKRALSVDFLDEVRRASRDKKGEGMDLIIHVPEAGRDLEEEAVIRERIANHAERHYQMQIKEKRSILGLGIGMVVLGIISMLAATAIIYEDPTDNALLSFLVVFLEPAAWFLLWEGMDQVMFTSKEINPELRFYKKLFNSHQRIEFRAF